jgi:hypothetical protein
MFNLDYTMKSVTCHTNNCSNAEIPIVVPVVVDGNVLCGVCNFEITDLAEVPE